MNRVVHFAGVLDRANVDGAFLRALLRAASVTPNWPHCMRSSSAPSGDSPLHSSTSARDFLQPRTPIARPAASSTSPERNSRSRADSGIGGDSKCGLLVGAFLAERAGCSRGRSVDVDLCVVASARLLQSPRRHRGTAYALFFQVSQPARGVCCLACWPGLLRVALPVTSVCLWSRSRALHLNLLQLFSAWQSRGSFVRLD